MRRFLSPLAVAMFALLLGEAAVRISRVTDVPTFHADNHIGYIPEQDQSGRWLWKSDYAFNELSMGTGRSFKPSPTGDVLLLGDSIVYGGINYREPERLGPAVQRLTRRSIWPASAPSWGLQNELQYMLDHPKMMRSISEVILITNSADYDGPSSWASDATHPRARGLSRLWMLLVKRFAGPSEVQLKYRVTPQSLPHMIERLRQVWTGPMSIVAYPTKAELSNSRQCGFDVLPALAAVGRVTCVKGAPGWGSALYRDDIHPTPEGNEVLAQIITRALTSHSAATPPPTR